MHGRRTGLPGKPKPTEVNLELVAVGAEPFSNVVARRRTVKTHGSMRCCRLVEEAEAPV